MNSNHKKTKVIDGKLSESYQVFQAGNSVAYCGGGNLAKLVVQNMVGNQCCLGGRQLSSSRLDCRKAARVQ